jgi:hypothetical protein
VGIDKVGTIIDKVGTIIDKVGLMKWKMIYRHLYCYFYAMNDTDKKLSCVLCNYHCSRNDHLLKHLASKKHVMINCPDTRCKFQCKKCNKKYKCSSGLWRHNKKCADEDKLDVASMPIENVDLIISELKKLNERIETLSNDVNSKHLATNVNNINNININVFLNETCKNAINLDSFIKNLTFELADPKLMIPNYVDGTCNILQRNLAELPLNKRPLHCMEGEDPNQQLMHIRQDDKWNIGTYVNWLEQIHADDDDDVVETNPIYYALKTIDEEKLKYLGYNFHQDVE